MVTHYQIILGIPICNQKNPVNLTDNEDKVSCKKCIEIMLSPNFEEIHGQEIELRKNWREKDVRHWPRPVDDGRNQKLGRYVRRKGG